MRRLLLTLFALTALGLCAQVGLRDPGFVGKMNLAASSSYSVDFVNFHETLAGGYNSVYTSNDIVSATSSTSGTMTTVSPSTNYFGITNEVFPSFTKQISVGGSTYTDDNKTTVAARLDSNNYYEFTLTNYVQSIAAGFWFRTTTTGSPFNRLDIFQFVTQSNSAQHVIQLKDYTGANFGFALEVTKPSTVYAEVLKITNSTTYWVCCRFDPSVFKMNYYDSSFNLIGSITNTSTSAVSVNRFSFGLFARTDAGKTNYMDNLIVDWGSGNSNNVKWPLLPQ